ncbi:MULTISPECIES: hypothetical protein [Pseudomonas syringae group genomosp. 2]|uniref:Uncharacterized protein n=3 Tax=Pseudomonas syringae group TaxID=136849 RepID=A0A0N8TBM5_PSEA0|nr:MULTISPECIES: hypothetical protein [Pseudomonas syringae group genomosp. 2]EGH04011.1 hypothetical protein PSYAE_19030 [Pseudomonas amygdali pv. aesculi str. 0893_23]KPC56931.1 Uncharacterized protein AC509_4599 [Pseudomonas amygdali pv. morsprunorum]KPW09891.1 Uncharacterized protein ALO90_03496 [Pseudomonas amygdali pv. aesculi]KPZ08409.1 Uncharacterized protein ALO41_03549 [Pseudomonas amygdali pv. ulmi]KWS20394.1 hypothetical protein AL065_23320 [Pseudomonas amygdali pv. ulmi]
MLLAVLTVLNALCLIGGLLFNAELLNKAGADIPLKNLQALEIYGQSLAAVSVCLAAWRLCIWAHGKWGHQQHLMRSILLSTVVLAPLTWWVQGVVPDAIAEAFPADLRVYSLYAYVTKKGLLYDSVQIPGIPYQEYRDKGEGKAFIANLGVLMSVQGSYVEQIGHNFQGFAQTVFKGYTRRNADRLYSRLQAEVIPVFDDIAREYAKVEALRRSGVAGNKRKPLALPNAALQQAPPSAEDYALAMPSGLRSRQAMANTAQVRGMARQVLGPLYVEGMDLLVTPNQFNTYLNGIASNMASDVARTDVHGAQSLSVLKNMWFVPWSLLSGLFMGALNIVGLLLSTVEQRAFIQKRLVAVRAAAVALIVVVPLLAGNAIIQSPGYRTAFKDIEAGPTLMAGVFHWAMSAEAMLYNLTRPLLNAE